MRARPALVGDDRPHRGRKAVRADGHRRVQRQPVGEVDPPARTDLERRPAGAPVEVGERYRDERIGERRRRRLLREAIVPHERAPFPPRRADGLEPAEAVQIVDQLVGLLADAVEDRPPGGLRLAPVELAEVEEEPLALRIEVRASKLGPQRRGPGVLARLVAAAVGCERRPGAGGPDPHEPVAQLLGRDAVDPVVVLDLVEDRLVPLFQPALVGGDRPAGGLGLACPLDAGEDLERLDRIVRLRREHPATHHRVESDEAPLPKQPVEEALPHPVQRRQPPQRRHLVGGIVIDPRPRMCRDPRPEGVEHRFQRRPLGVVVVRPDRPEAPCRYSSPPSTCGSPSMS